MKKCEKDIGWQPVAVSCNYTSISYELSNKCPDGYVPVNDDICVLIHASQPFMSSCVDSLVPFTIYNMSAVELETFFEFLRNNSPGQQFWLPAKQTYTNGSMRLGFRYTINEIGLQWTMPAFFGENVSIDDDCPTCTLEAHGGCLSFVPILNSDNRFNTSVTSCSLRHLKSFCLFRKTESLHKLACPNGYVAPLMPKGRNLDCINIKKFDAVSVSNVSNNIVSEHCPRQGAFRMNSVLATFNYALLANQSTLSSDVRCLFALTNNTAWNVAINESDFVDMLGDVGPFVNWDISMGFHDFNSSTNRILSANYLGKWFWESNEVSCIVCMEKPSLKMPRLELRYDSIKDQLTLEIINYDYLMTRHTNNLKFMCFAEVHNQYNANLRAILLTNVPEFLYDIKLIGPGNYWCSGHAIHSGAYLQTEKIFAQGIVMSMMVECHCRPNRCFNFESNFTNFLYHHSYIINPAHIQIGEVRNISFHYPANVDFVNILFHVNVNIMNEGALRTEQNRLNLPDEMLTYYYVRQKFVLISQVQANQSIFQIRSVNSTDYCLPSSISILSAINWLGAGINETIESVGRCIGSNGRPLLRRCVGDKDYGLTWLRLSLETQCFEEDSSDLTEDLEELANNFEDPEQSKEVIESLRDLIANSSDRLVRMDIFLVSRIMGRVTDFLDKRTLTVAELNNLAVIYNNIMLVKPGIARSSATFNSTNVLLESLDLILIHKAAQLRNVSKIISSDSLAIDTMMSYFDQGIVINVSPMLINFVIDPMLTDVSGVALIKKENSYRFGVEAPGLKDFTVHYLYRNQSETDLLLQSALVVASFFPKEILLDILITHPDAKLVFTIFYNDILFQTVENTTYTKSDGKIIAVTVPGLNELPGILPIYVKPENTLNDYCGYWDYNYVEGWSETGCSLITQNFTTAIVMCGCTHLTHFAYLLRGNSSQFEGIHLRTLQGITVLGCTLSLIGIMGIYITAIQFRSWRSKTSTKYLLQLSTAIAFQMILLAFVNTAPMTQLLLLTNNEHWCIFIGVLLHYFVLAMFFWMLIIAYLQFVRYVIVFNHVKTPRFLLKSSLLGWTLPMIPVLLVVSVDSDTYIPDLYFSESQICYPSGYSLYFGILLPIGVIVGANLVIFILVNYNLLRGTNAVCKAGDRNTKLSQLRLSIFLFFLLGLTWIFGLMSTAFAETSIVFSYLFCLTSTLQGFVMFLYFVILDPVARNLWIYFFKRICFSKRGNIDIRKECSSKESY